MSDATEDLVEQVGHPFMIQVHVDHLAKAGIHQLHHQIPERGGRNEKQLSRYKKYDGASHDRKNRHKEKEKVVKKYVKEQWQKQQSN